MKNYIIPSALAAILLLFSSCSRELDSAADQVSTQTISFYASETETKTEFGSKTGGKYPVIWKDGDRVAISHNWSDYTTGSGYTAEISDEGRSARFVGDFQLADGANTFIVVSPFAAAKSRAESSKRILVEWPAAQSPVLSAEGQPSSPDPLAQVLVARKDYDSRDDITSPIDLQFYHLSAYLRMKFKSVDLRTSSGDATVLSVSIGAENTQLAGRFQYYFEDGHFDVNADGFNAVTASVSSFEENSDIWVGIRPVDLSGETLTFTITTDKGSLTKEVTLPVGDKYNLSRGSVATFTVNMDDSSIVEPTVYTKVSDPAVLAWGDRIIIAAADEDIGLSTVQNTNNRSGTSVTKVNDGVEKILDPSDDVQIITLEDGVVPGQFSFYVGDGYLYAKNDGTIGQTSNILQTIADKTGKENHASWIITNDNGTTRIKANLEEGGSDETTVRPHLRYNSESNIFTAYSGKNSQSAIAVYYCRPDDGAKHFVATMDKDGETISSAATTLKVNVFSNVNWTAEVTAGGGRLSADSGSGTTISGSGNAVLTLNIPENSDFSDITHTVTVSTDASETEESSYTLTLTQQAPFIFTLVTSASQLAADDEIIIVAYDDEEGKYYALGSTQLSGKRNATEVTVSDNSVIPGDGVEIISLSKWSGTAYYQLEATQTSGYLYANNAYTETSTNSISTREDNTDDNSGYWSIWVEPGTFYATIRAYEGGSEKAFNAEIRFNKTDDVFRCYVKTSSMVKVQIFRRPLGNHPVDAPAFPIEWTFSAPGANWVEGTDYYIYNSGPNGSFVYSNDHHSGMIAAARQTASNTGSTNTYYRSKTINGKTGYFFETNGMGVGGYWLFEIPRVNNPEGTYNISYSTCSTNAGGKLFVLEYSVDEGATWTAFDGTLTNQSWELKNNGGTVTVDYTYVLAPTTNENQEWLDVSKDFRPGAVNGTLLIRARVGGAVKNDNSVLANNPGGTSTLYNPIITFTAD